MRHRIGASRGVRFVIPLILVQLVSFIQAVALVDFTPRIDDLQGNCAAVYNQPINGCQPSDFTGDSPRCSPECANGLVEIQGTIQKACAGVAVSEKSIVGLFLRGQGIPKLCPNFQVTTILPDPPQSTTPPPPAPPPPEDDDPPATTEEPQSSSTEAAASPPYSPSSSESAPPPATTSSAGIATENLPPPPPPTSVSIPATNRPASTSNRQELPTQLSNPDSGGGSPFDVQAFTGGATSQLSQKLMTSILIIVAGVLVPGIL